MAPGVISLSPVVQHERVSEFLHPLIVGHVSRNKGQTVVDRDCGNHRIGAARGLSDSFQVSVDASSQIRGSHIESQDLNEGQAGKQLFDAVLASDL